MEAVAVAPKAKEERKGQAVLMPERFGEAEFKRHDFVADIPAGTTLEQILEPAYWAHVSKDMDPFDHIEARAEDGSWVAYLVVLFAERTYARVKLDRAVKIDEAIEQADKYAKHKVEWKGPHFKFAVIRMSDNAKVQDGFKTRPEADAWMRNHEKAQ